MTAERQRLGQCGERLAAEALESSGWRIVDRNARPAGIRGELDIVAIDGRDLVFVEVKTGREGSAAGPVDPAEHVGAVKLKRLRQLAGAWLAANRHAVPSRCGLRIDVVSMRLDAAGRPTAYRHLKGVA